MRQSRTMSLVEAIANVGVGFGVLMTGRVPPILVVVACALVGELA